jgi:hypothetical protein
MRVSIIHVPLASVPKNPIDKNRSHTIRTILLLVVYKYTRHELLQRWNERRERWLFDENREAPMLQLAVQSRDQSAGAKTIT